MEAENSTLALTLVRWQLISKRRERDGSAQNTQAQGSSASRKDTFFNVSLAGDQIIQPPGRVQNNTVLFEVAINTVLSTVAAKAVGWMALACKSGKAGSYCQTSGTYKKEVAGPPCAQSVSWLCTVNTGTGDQGKKAPEPN